MKIPFTQEGIRLAIGKMETLKDNLIIAGQESVSELIEKGSQRANDLNNIAPQTGVEKSQVIGDFDNTDTGAFGEISLIGRNAIYDEFGIGEEGASDPHPLKGNFGLNDYNSGPVVSSHINSNGEHYWFYGPMKGKPYFDSKSGYTEGVPSGKQMFNTSLYIRDIKDDVLKNKIKDAIKFVK